MQLLSKFGDHRSYRNGDINSYNNSYIDTPEAGLTTSIRQIAILLKSGIQDYRFKIPKSRIGLAEKPHDGKGHWWLQGVMHSTQTQ